MRILFYYVLSTMGFSTMVHGLSTMDSLFKLKHISHIGIIVGAYLHIGYNAC
jgi:hypothetical protein